MAENTPYPLRSLSLGLLKSAQQSLAPTPRTGHHPRVRWWLGLTLLYSTLIAVLIGDSISGNPYALADDARQHVFWMLRFTDPALFANDWIADYYQSVSPIGYIWLYRLAALVGLSPLLLCKLLPPVLIVLTAGITFFTVLELSALPAAGFAASALLTQSVEYTGTVASGTSKAFVYGLMLLFIYAWLRKSLVWSWSAIALQGMFYPQTVLLTAGLLVLGLVERRQGRWRLSPDRQRWWLTGGGLIIATLVILYYALSTSQFGPTMTAAEALTMPEFFRGGRTNFFQTTWLDALLYGRGGLRLDTAMTPVTNLLGLLLPLMIRWPRRFPLAPSIRPEIDLLPKLVVTAVFWFVAAHALLFKLYLPSRYTGRFLLIVFVLAGGIATVVLIESLLRGAIALLQLTATGRATRRSGLASLPTALAGALALLVVLYPLTMPGYPSTSMVRGNAPELYTFLATTPKESLVASLSVETSNIPSFSQRAVLLSSEIAIPYHAGYYEEIRQRAKALIAAQYSADPQVVTAFIERYGVTHWLLETTAFDVHALNRDRWVQQYQPEAGQATTVLANGQSPLLQTLGDRCVTFQTPQHTVLDARCIVSAIAPS